MNTKTNMIFFNDIYTYFMRGGYTPIVLDNILTMIMIGSTLSFIIFISFFLDWNFLIECESPIMCKNMSNYILSISDIHDVSTLIFMYILIIFAVIYWVAISIPLTMDIFKFKQYKNHFKHILKINDDDLMTLKWNELVMRIVDASKLNGHEIMHDFIIASIMKRENYLISMVSSNIFEINTIFYTKSFVNFINDWILKQIFHKENIDIIERDKIKENIKRAVIIQIFILPFSLCSKIFGLLINLISDVYTKNPINGSKEWTMYARIRFREYDELLHVFEERINKSYKYVSRFESTFTSHSLNIFMKKISFICGTYLTALVLMTLYDERLVMYINAMGRNLLWYIAILTFVITMTRNVSHDYLYDDINYTNSEEIMEKINEYTYFFPDKWKGNCNKLFVLYELRTLYNYKIINNIIDIISMIIIPFYTLLNIEKITDTVVLFIEQNTISNHFKYSIINTIDNVEYNEYDDEYNEHIETDNLIKLNDTKALNSRNHFINYYNIHKNIISSSII